MTAGPLSFARYAFPPNERGYCGPAENAALGGYATGGYAAGGSATAGGTDPGLTQLAMRFEGAWPYLELIASANGIADPLDGRVVEAYWVGNPLLENARVAEHRGFLDERFRRGGRGWEPIAAAISADAVPHHSFHVLCVYPWSGMLREGRTEPSLQVLDSCRISWGRVVTIEPVVVSRRPLTWDGHALALGSPVPCQVEAGFVTGLRPGDWVSLHWSRVCERLSAPQLRALRRYTDRHLRLVNAIMPERTLQRR